jgi:fucokinase
LILASRHYEAGAQRLIAKAVNMSSQFVTMTSVLSPPPGSWVLVTAPLRIDLAGGWTDTPPISFEQGGAVTNLAVSIDG